jgi:molecular chaperone HtpG
MWDRKIKRGLKLYVRRVFIMDDADKLLPAYLRFVRGVVDSADLPLNVSRELLQEGRDIDTIRSGCTKKVLSLLEDLAENDDQAQKDKYAGFWKEFGSVFKEGVGEDTANRERIAKLLRFASTRLDTDEQSVSLTDYLSRMKDGQSKIYYVTAESFKAAKNSPHLEVFRKKGIEVLLMQRTHRRMGGGQHDRLRRSRSGVGRQGRARSGRHGRRGGKAGTRARRGRIQAAGRTPAGHAGRAGEGSAHHASADRLAGLPGVGREFEIGGNLARILKSAGQQAPVSKPILEINPQHPVVQRLKYEDKHFDEPRSSRVLLPFPMSISKSGVAPSTR